MHQVLILTAYQCSTIKYLSSHDAHTRQAQTHTRMHTRTLVYTQLNLPCCQSLLHMQRKMFNYNAENNNNYNSDNNNSRARAEWGPEWEAVGKRYDEESGSGGEGGMHLAAAAAAGARVNLSRRHISKWRRLIDISADYFMATHTHTCTCTCTHRAMHNALTPVATWHDISTHNAKGDRPSSSFPTAVECSVCNLINLHTLPFSKWLKKSWNVM